MTDLIEFERIEIAGGERRGHTVYVCRIKSVLNEQLVELQVKIELPYSDKKLSEIWHEIAKAIHEATNPARLDSSRSY